MPLHILHAADFHLDAPFSALPADKAAQRRGEQRDLLTRLADAARTRRADLVLLSGDLFDGADCYGETAQALSRALGQTGCPVFIAPGNHDFYAPRSPYAAIPWPDNVHIFTGAQLAPVDLPDKPVTVWGAAFTAPSRDDDPLAEFTAPDDGRLHLGVVHGDVDGRSRYCPIAAQSIAQSGLAYLALGHVHAASGLHKDGATFWAYPGCPEGRGFDELGDKGCLWLTVDGPGGVEAQFVPLALRRYRILEVDVSDGPAAALDAALPPDYHTDILRILLTGESGVEGLDLAPLEALAAPRCYGVDLRDRTQVRRDLWDRAGEDTLTGLFLRRMRDKRSAAQTPEDQALVDQAVRFGLAALEHREEPMA